MSKLTELIEEFINGWTKWNLYDHEKKEYQELDLDHTHIERMKKELQAIMDEAHKERLKDYGSSKDIIGKVHESFDELKHKYYDWSSYYNAWLNGRAEMLNEIKKLPQPETGINK